MPTSSRFKKNGKLEKCKTDVLAKVVLQSA
jgi:hypothetical protein